MVRDEGRREREVSLPVVRAPDRRPRSSSPSPRYRLRVSRPRGRSSSARPRPGRTGPAGPWRGRTAARGGVRRPFDPIAVDLSRRDPRHKHVPVVVGPVGRRIDPDHAGRRSVVSDQRTRVRRRGCPRKQAEIDAAVNDGSAEGELRPMVLAEARGETSPGLLAD